MFGSCRNCHWPRKRLKAQTNERMREGSVPPGHMVGGRGGPMGTEGGRRGCSSPREGNPTVVLIGPVGLSHRIDQPWSAAPARSLSRGRVGSARRLQSLTGSGQELQLSLDQAQNQNQKL